MATLDATDIYLNAVDNLSSYESRYDKFAFTLGALTKGQYRYEVTENPATYAAGDFVQGGLYTFTDSGYAYITAATDQSSSAQWGCEGTDIAGTVGSIGTGPANTALIVAGCDTAGIAARLADQLVLNGFSDWFLPSVAELSAAWLYLASQSLGSFANHTYWTSVQLDSDHAFTINMNSGSGLLGNHKKGNTSNRYTRAMRRFLLPVTPPRVIETGLAMIEMTEGSFTSTTNTIDYVSYD